MSSSNWKKKEEEKEKKQSGTFFQGAKPGHRSLAALPMVRSWSPLLMAGGYHARVRQTRVALRPAYPNTWGRLPSPRGQGAASRRAGMLARGSIPFMVGKHAHPTCVARANVVPDFGGGRESEIISPSARPGVRTAGPDMATRLRAHGRARDVKVETHLACALGVLDNRIGEAN